MKQVTSMTIQNTTSVNTTNNDVIKHNTFTSLFNNTNINNAHNNHTRTDNEILTPEQKNTLQDDFISKITEQADNIKSSFQTAKDIQLTRSYYEQQQKLIDIYMNTGDTNTVNNTLNINVTNTLIDTYASLYQLHQTIKAGGQTLPENPEISPLPAELPQHLMNDKTKAYNSFMMPTTNSHLHLQA